MDPLDDRWQKAVDAEVDLALDATTNWLAIISRTMLGLSLGGVIVGVGGILVLTSMLGECAEPGCKGSATWVMTAIGAAMMVAGPVLALRIAGLKWWQALAGAPALGAIAWALFTAGQVLFA